MQAAIIADEGLQGSKLVDKFVERAVMRWIRMILLHQPNAELAFIVTKEDVLANNKGTRQVTEQALLVKLREVERVVQKMRQRAAGVWYAQNDFEFDSTVAAGMEEDTNEPKVVFATSDASVHATRARVEILIFQSARSFQMPDTYAQALNAIVEMREAARTNGMCTRIRRMLAPVDLLPSALRINPTLCRTILRTLHDLGDVLWYEDHGADLFQTTAVLDPLLLIDFIRQVINHNDKDVVVSHTDLRSEPFWVELTDRGKFWP